MDHQSVHKICFFYTEFRDSKHRENMELTETPALALRRAWVTNIFYYDVYHSIYHPPHLSCEQHRWSGVRNTVRGRELSPWVTMNWNRLNKLTSQGGGKSLATAANQFVTSLPHYTSKLERTLAEDLLTGGFSTKVSKNTFYCKNQVRSIFPIRQCLHCCTLQLWKCMQGTALMRSQSPLKSTYIFSSKCHQHILEKGDIQMRDSYPIYSIIGIKMDIWTLKNVPHP